MARALSGRYNPTMSRRFPSPAAVAVLVAAAFLAGLSVDHVASAARRD